MIVIAGSLTIDPAQRDAAVAASTEMMAATLQEPGCRAYQFSFAMDDPAKVCIFEQWDDQAALDAHFAAPHMAAFGAKAAGFIVGRGDFTKYEIASSGPLFG
jgi:quinol monooxygenase YgiN